MATLDELTAYEASILKAMGSTTAEIWYDNYHKKNRPVGELQAALLQVRREKAAAAGTVRNPIRKITSCSSGL